jgi:hypothetical protein
MRVTEHHPSPRALQCLMMTFGSMRILPPRSKYPSVSAARPYKRSLPPPSGWETWWAIHAGFFRPLTPFHDIGHAVPLWLTIPARHWRCRQERTKGPRLKIKSAAHEQIADKGLTGSFDA